MLSERRNKIRYLLLNEIKVIINEIRIEIKSKLFKQHFDKEKIKVLLIQEIWLRNQELDESIIFRKIINFSKIKDLMLQVIYHKGINEV